MSNCPLKLDTEANSGAYFGTEEVRVSHHWETSNFASDLSWLSLWFCLDHLFSLADVVAKGVIKENLQLMSLKN